MKPGKVSAFSVFSKKKKQEQSAPATVLQKTSQGKVHKVRHQKLRLSNQWLETFKPNGEPKAAKKLSPAKKAFRQKQSPSQASRKSIRAERIVPSDDEKKLREDADEKTDDSSRGAERRFSWLIDPIPKEQFFGELWEKKPMLLKRHNANYYTNLFSCSHLDRILREKVLYFTENIDITTYENGKRETHNPEGRAHASVVWDSFQRGCSVRLLNPQTYSRAVWRLCSQLQEFFSSFVGANVYLTPAGSQGFAPHYDDIEAFVLQLEGKKKWKLYAPRTPSEELPRYSSGNMSEDEIGEPILSVLLEPGDLLYFPRGIIHQARTTEGTHSLHITVSTCQKNTWGDLFEKMLPRALQLAMEDDVEFRRSLPRDYLRCMGVANSDLEENPSRDAFLGRVRYLLDKLVTYCPIDAAVDQMGKSFVHDSLPPVLSDDEKRCSVHDGELWVDGRVVNAQELNPDAEVRLIRQTAIRLVMEEDTVRIYHALDNSRVYHEREPVWFDLGAENAPAVETLLHAYPQYTRVDDLPLADQLQRVELASTLYERGLLRTREPLDGVDDDDDD